MSPMKNTVIIRRGDIFAVDLSQDKRKSLIRPVLVIQNDIGNRFCNSIIVAPLIPEVKTKRLFFSVLITANRKTGLLKDHVALFSQIRTLERKDFTNDNYLGRVDFETMQKVDRAIELSLGLSTIQKLQSRYERAKEKKLLS